MTNAGSSLLGLGKAKGPDRAKLAAQRAISSPLLDLSINGATRVLFNVSGGRDMSLVEINSAARVITESISKNAQVIFGTSFDRDLKQGEIKVTVIAGGFETETRELGYPLPLGVKIPIEEIEKPEETESQLLIEDNKELEIPAF